jgi:hypothetical protein
LFRVAERKLDVEPRFVILVNAQGLQVPVGTKEDRSAVVCGGDDEDHTEGALELDMVENLMIKHDRVIGRLHLVKTLEVVPGDLAIVSCRAAGTRALRSLVQIAEIGIETPFADLLKPKGMDTRQELRFAVIAIRDDIPKLT